MHADGTREPRDAFNQDEAPAKLSPVTPANITEHPPVSGRGNGGRFITCMADSSSDKLLNNAEREELAKRAKAFWAEYRPSLSPKERLGLIQKHAGTLTGPRRMAFLEMVMDSHQNRNR